MPPRPRPIRPPAPAPAAPTHSATQSPAVPPPAASSTPASFSTPKDSGTSKPDAASTPATQQPAPAAADTVASVVSTVLSEVPVVGKPFLGDEVEKLNNAFKGTVIKAGDIMRYQSHVRKSKLATNVPRVPYALASSLARELEKFDEVCDAIETSLLKAYGQIAAELDRRKADKTRAALVASPPPESARAASSPPLPLSLLVGGTSAPSPPASRHTSPRLVTRDRPVTATSNTSRPVPPPLKTNLSGGAIRPSAVHLSALPTSDGPPGRLHRLGLNLDLSATKLFGVNPDMLASPVTLAPKSKAQNTPPMQPGTLPPELLSALQHQQEQQQQAVQMQNMLASPAHIQATISPQRQPMQMPIPQLGNVGVGLPLLSAANMMGPRNNGQDQSEPMDINMDFLNVSGGSDGQQGLSSGDGPMVFLGVNPGAGQGGSDVGTTELESFLNSRPPPTQGMDISAGASGAGAAEGLFGDMSGQQQQDTSMNEGDNDAAIAGLLASIGAGEAQGSMPDAGQGLQAAPAFGAEDGNDLLASFTNVGGPDEGTEGNKGVSDTGAGNGTNMDLGLGGMDFSLDLDSEFLSSFGKTGSGQVGQSPGRFGAGGQGEDDLNGAGGGEIDFSGFDLYTDMQGFSDYGLGGDDGGLGGGGAGGGSGLLGIGLDSQEKDGIVDMGGALDFDELFKGYDDGMDTEEF